jgi:hypothetical protein
MRTLNLFSLVAQIPSSVVATGVTGAALLMTGVAATQAPGADGRRSQSPASWLTIGKINALKSP